MVGCMHEKEEDVDTTSISQQPEEFAEVVREGRMIRWIYNEVFADVQCSSKNMSAIDVFHFAILKIPLLVVVG
jgi:hypothetical protein